VFDSDGLKSGVWLRCVSGLTFWYVPSKSSALSGMAHIFLVVYLFV